MGRTQKSGQPPAARLLTRAQAAVYCGFCSSTVSTLCPVRPISLGHDKRLERYDVVALNDWIDRLGEGSMQLGRDWLSAMDKENDGGSR